MDQVKMFLRYETSGAIYFIWLILFYLSLNPEANGSFIVHKLIDEKDKLPWGGFILAFPIGVILHQISVNLKNKVVCRFYEFLDDDPVEKPTKVILDRLNIIDINKSLEKTFEYVRNRISSLNSFYYARIDNGIIAPFFAWCSAVILRSYSEKKTYYEFFGNNIDWCRTLLMITLITLFILIIIACVYNPKKSAVKIHWVNISLILVTFGYSCFQLLYVSTNCLFTVFCIAAIFIGVMMASYVPRINSEIKTYCRRI